MRNSIFVLCCLPTLLVAEDFVVNSRATEATIFAYGAQVTHEVNLSLLAGSHRIILPDLPHGISVEQIRVSAPGLRLGSLRYRTDFVPPRDTEQAPAIAAAEEEIERIEDEIQAVEDRLDGFEARRAAAEDQITFLNALGKARNLPENVEDLRALSLMIREETKAARHEILSADVNSRGAQDALKNLTEDLADAKTALDALVPEAEDRPLLIAAVDAENDVQDIPFRVSFFAEALWRPAYDLRLSDGDQPSLVIERSADVFQFSGENWEDIRLTLSTQVPTEQSEPSTLRPDLRSLLDPEIMAIRTTRSLATADSSVAEPIIEAPVVVEEASVGLTVSESGLSVNYSYADPVSVASEADALRLPFDALEFDAELIARAVPMRDDQAFLVARFTNSSAEPLLQADEVMKIFDGTLVGMDYIFEIAPGEETEIGFGAIDGLQIKRTVINRAEGDRGLINRSNEQTERVRIDLENLTDRTWNVELRDRVPFSEQEDLKITYTADPAPDIDAVDDKRGVLQWNIEMEPGNQARVNTSFKMTWPEDQIVR